MTPKRKFFYQNQTNFYSGPKVETKSHFVFGITNRWEAGFNVLNTGFDFSGTAPIFTDNHRINGDPLSNIFVFTTQCKLLKLKKWHLTTGGQAGANLTRRIENVKFAYRCYLLAVWKPKENTLLAFGPYFANEPMTGEGLPVGVKTGFEYPLIGKKLLLMGDSIVGDHALAVSVLGGAYEVAEGFQLCLGLQFPSDPGFDNSWGIVAEVNLYNF